MHDLKTIYKGGVGGLLGAASVFVIVWVVPKIGVTSVLISVIAGQILIGLIIDHFGLFGSRSIPIDYKKSVAILLLFTSLYIFNQK